jgi:predicted enzyme related to lactoylglutathione lyase
MDVDTNQPLGTPTWIDLGVPDLDRALEFYGAVFGWDFDTGPEEYGRYTMCLLRGRRAAGISAMHEPSAGVFWNVYLATDDCDGTAARAREAGGVLLVEPMDVTDAGRMAVVRDPVGAQFGLWQGRDHVGSQVVNEPGSLVRNDLVTPDPERAREFYAAVFDFTLDRNEDMPEANFTFLRRPDGHEVGGIMGAPSGTSSWSTTFEVAGTDEAVRRALDAGGSSDGPRDFLYGRLATITDPFGAEFTVITRPET